MSKKFKPLRIFGEVPADYSGSIYYRTAHHNLTRRTVQSYAKFGKEALDLEFNQLANQGYLRGRRILTPGMFLDAQGALLPKWQTPRKVQIVKNKPLPYEISGDGLSGLITERIHDAITAVEPGMHVFFPYDAVYPDGSTDRLYSLFLGKAYLASDFIRPECLFALSKHRIESDTREDGVQYFKEPEFMLLGGTQSNDFFYLNRKLVRSRHLFSSDFGASGRSVTYFSQDLMDRLAPFGDIFSSDVDCVRIGVAD